MRPLLAVATAAFAALVTLAGSSPAAADEPALEVHPGRSGCVAPFEVIATGLEPSQPVEVSFNTGWIVTGSVDGRTGPDGTFRSPIPLILLPCAEGGTVGASIKVGGELLPVVAEFEIVELAARTASPAASPPPSTPAPPGAGTGPEHEPVTSRGSLWVLVSVAVIATTGAVAAWITRDPD